MLRATNSIPKPKERALHVLVPEEAHLRARMAAVMSRLPFKHFMAHLMMSATPIIVAEVPLAPEPLGSPRTMLLQSNPRVLPQAVRTNGGGGR